MYRRAGILRAVVPTSVSAFFAPIFVYLSPPHPLKLLHFWGCAKKKKRKLRKGVILKGTHTAPTDGFADSLARVLARIPHAGALSHPSMNGTDVL